MPADRGPLELTARLHHEGRDLDQRTVSVTPTAKPSVLRRAADFVTEHSIAIVPAVLLAALVVAAGYVRRLKAALSEAEAGHPRPASEPLHEPDRAPRNEP